jgi:hypothetical protein
MVYERRASLFGWTTSDPKPFGCLSLAAADLAAGDARDTGQSSVTTAARDSKEHHDRVRAATRLRSIVASRHRQASGYR